MKKLGYTNIKIYNGGLKDWQKAGNPVEVIEALPKYQGNGISTDELFTRLQETELKGCGTVDDPSLTILDLRTLSSLRKKDSQVPDIKTTCPVHRMLFDTLRDQDVRDQIPHRGLVVMVCETGNRGNLVMRYLSQFGFTNIVVLKFGMRGWLKAGYPIITDND